MEIQCFNPRPPRGGATSQPMNKNYRDNVSIRAPRVEGRPRLASSTRRETRFNPRPPRGGATTQWLLDHGQLDSFNPRPPRGGATQLTKALEALTLVSIRAPRVEGRP